MAPTPAERRGARAGVAGLGAVAALGLGTGIGRRRIERRRAADPELRELLEPPGGREHEITSHDGTALHARVFGPDDAPTVVLCHGWTCDLRTWTYQVRALSPEYRVIAYDHRGHGRSGTPADGDYSIESLGADLDAVLAELAPAGERPVLAGHSMGAMSIVAWARGRRGPASERTRGTALVSTGMGDLLTEMLVVGAPPALAGVRRALGERLLRTRVRPPRIASALLDPVVSYVTLGPDAGPAKAAFTGEMVFGCRTSVRAGCGRMLSGLDLMDGMSRLDVPTVVVSGERDRLTPPSHSRRMIDALPGTGELVRIPRTGHMTPYEAPDRVTAVLRRLLDGPGAS